MSSSEYQPKVVMVSRDAMPAFDCPTLIVKQGDSYYVSLAVWKIDTKYPNPDREQQEGIKEVERIFNAARREPANAELDAVVLDHHVEMFVGMATPRPGLGGG